MTYEEFLAWADGPCSAEWVDGEVIALTSPSYLHQELLGFLFMLLRHFADAQELGKVQPAPFQMKTGADLPGRQPDLLFIAQEHLFRFKKNHLDGPADLAVEIESPESRDRDRVDKFYEYERGRVREYWLIDPEEKRAEFFQLGDDGKYFPAPVGEDGVYRSAVLKGLWIKVEWLWQDPLPPVLDILKDWGVI